MPSISYLPICLPMGLPLTDSAVRIDGQSPNMMSKSCDQSLTIYFYSQGDVDNSVRSALNLSDGQTGENFGVRVWTDEDEWRVRQPQFENRREKAHGNDCIIVGLEACRRPILHTEVGFHFMPKT